MKTIFEFLIIFSVLLVEFECATSCYGCTYCPEPFDNSTAVLLNCALGSSTCIKTTIRYPGGAFITKGCVPAAACTSSSLGIAGVGYWIDCCTTDDCNSAFVKLPELKLLVSGIFITIFYFTV